MRISDWSSDVCSSDLLGATGWDRAWRAWCRRRKARLSRVAPWIAPCGAMPECGEPPEPVHRMSSSVPPPSSGRRKSVLGLTPRAWLYVAIAFAVGIGLFLLIWAKQRAEDDFYRADTNRQSATG